MSRSVVDGVDVLGQAGTVFESFVACSAVVPLALTPELEGFVRWPFGCSCHCDSVEQRGKLNKKGSSRRATTCDGLRGRSGKPRWRSL